MLIPSASALGFNILQHGYLEIIQTQHFVPANCLLLLVSVKIDVVFLIRTELSEEGIVVKLSIGNL